MAIRSASSSRRSKKRGSRLVFGPREVPNGTSMVAATRPGHAPDWLGEGFSECVAFAYLTEDGYIKVGEHLCESPGKDPAHVGGVRALGADAWREEIGDMVPCVPIDLTSETPTITVGRLEIRQYFKWRGDEIEEVPPEPEPEPEPNDDTTPTTTTIDDVFAEHDGDEGEAQQ